MNSENNPMYQFTFIEWLQTLKQFDNNGKIIVRTKTNKKLITFRNKCNNIDICTSLYGSKCKCC